MKVSMGQLVLHPPPGPSVENLGVEEAEEEFLRPLGASNGDIFLCRTPIGLLLCSIIVFVHLHPSVERLVVADLFLDCGEGLLAVFEGCRLSSSFVFLHPDKKVDSSQQHCREQV